jgi:predicted DNA binding CopG/RHH family protein
MNQTRVTVRLSTDLLRRVEAAAAGEDLPVAEWVRDRLRESVCDHKMGVVGICSRCGLVL